MSNSLPPEDRFLWVAGDQFEEISYSDLSANVLTFSEAKTEDFNGKTKKIHTQKFIFSFEKYHKYVWSGG